MANADKFDLEIIIPSTIEVVHMEDKVRFRGNKKDIDQFVQEFYKLKALTDGQLCKLGNYVLKVSDYITEDSIKPNWIELPACAWGIMGSKFREVANELEDNPFDFNDCAYTNRIPFDIGVEVMDLPIQYMIFHEDGTYETKIIHRSSVE
ncbi:hypothetical protein [Chitinophaga sp. Cy-1792]|uniref:hypothetical protein n=1 Tax=Chitinophaga sp. Cy-1792 TaxID=2608339 RepID=UPI00141DBACB|nr:hypothetical protein [Chitinophaga sp. Cy-1792]NIG52589.1 hypothetical protein [Chitinophaga sp. Cy-1792]